MKKFISFVRKEFCHILRDKRTLLILLAMPVVMIMLFGFALSTEIKDVKVAVYDPSVDAASTRITHQIDASKYFTITRMISNTDEINDLFINNSVDMVIVLEENFYNRVLHEGNASIQVIADGSNTNVSAMGVVYLSNIVSSFQREMAQEKMEAAIGVGLTPVAPIMIETSSKMLYNPQLKSAFNFVPGVMGMVFMLICAMMTSISIVREKQRGTMEVLLVSPVKPFSIILSKTIPYLVISAFNFLTIMILSVFVLKVPVSGSLSWLFAVSTLFILVSLTMGIFISSVVSSQEVAILISSLVLMLPTMLLSGMLFPVESMPKLLQWCSYFVPAKWYIECVRMIMIGGLGIKYCLSQVLILFGFEVVLVSASIFTFKDRL